MLCIKLIDVPLFLIYLSNISSLNISFEDTFIRFWPLGGRETAHQVVSSVFIKTSFDIFWILDKWYATQNPMLEFTRYLHFPEMFND